MTKVSIITVNFNNAAGLEKTVLSVITKNYQPIESLIIIDGDSTDGSVDIIKRYSDNICY